MLTYADVMLTSAYVSRLDACIRFRLAESIRQHASAYVDACLRFRLAESIRQHTSAYVDACIRFRLVERTTHECRMQRIGLDSTSPGRLD